MLTSYRAGLVACLDARGQQRLSPASAALKLAALCTFLKLGDQLTGIVDQENIGAIISRLPRFHYDAPLPDLPIVRVWRRTLGQGHVAGIILVVGA
jgi:hypothetical protein